MAGTDNGPTSKSIYEDVLAEDTPIIQSIITEINVEINKNIFGDQTNPQDYPGNAMNFYYDTDSITHNLNPIQTNRVVNSVIKYYRMRGIRCVTANTLYYQFIAEKAGEDFVEYVKEHGLSTSWIDGEQWPSEYVVGYNDFKQKNYILVFSFYVRTAMEYMKNYM